MSKLKVRNIAGVVAVRAFKADVRAKGGTVARTVSLDKGVYQIQYSMPRKTRRPAAVGVFSAHLTSKAQLNKLVQFCKQQGIDYEPDVDWQPYEGE